QVGHHALADGLRRHFALAEAFQLLHDLGDGLLDALGLDIALAQRDLDRARELVAVERQTAAVALDHGEFAQLHALERREAELTGEAHAAAPDRGRILGRPRVLHLRVEATALRATHVPAPALPLLIDRKPLRQRLHLVAHRALDQRILL